MRWRVTVVVCFCVSAKSHLTSGESVRPENTITHSAGNGGQKFVGLSLKPLHSKVMASYNLEYDSIQDSKLLSL